MKKSIKLFLVLSTTIIMVSLSGCKAIDSYEWQQVYDVYSQEEGKCVFQSFKATITNLDVLNDNKRSEFKLVIDEEDYLERYKENTHAKATLGEYKSQGYYFVDESIIKLKEVGFFENINEDTLITFTVNNYVGWDGWNYPIFSVKIGDNVYLDFETGYENVLNYVQEKIKNPFSS